MTTKEAGGNFLGQLSPLEALGVWRQPDFRSGRKARCSNRASCWPARSWRSGSCWCWRRREWAMLAGALGAISSMRWLARSRSAYFSGKALTVAAPLLTLVAVTALAAIASSGRTPAPAHAGALAATAALAAYVARRRCIERARAQGGACAARPSAGHDLAAFRPLVERRADHCTWAATTTRRGSCAAPDCAASSATTRLLALGIAELPRQVRRGRRAHRPSDVDSVAPELLAARPLSRRAAHRLRIAATSRLPADRDGRAGTCCGSAAAGRCRVAILAEGEAPGKVSSAAPGGRGRRHPGVAYVRPPPVVGRSGAWRAARARRLTTASFREQELTLAPGRWDISLRYFSDVPLRLRAGSIDDTLPAYLSDESTFASAGTGHQPGRPPAGPGRRGTRTAHRHRADGAPGHARRDSYGRRRPTGASVARVRQVCRLVSRRAPGSG